MSIKYAAYGSNMNLRQMSYRCPTATILGISEIRDYKLLFRSTFLTIEKSIGNSVPILIWNLEDSDERFLDLYEGYPTFYRKEKMQIDFENQPTEVMVYIMNDGHRIQPPTRSYYEGVLEGYMAAGLDDLPLKTALKESQTNYFDSP